MKTNKKFRDYNDAEKYLGSVVECRKGYAAEEEIRKNAASGGMITALLCFLLQKKIIDGAWVSKSKVEDGKLSYDTFIATSPEEIREASSSIYMDMPLLKHIDMVRQFEGKVAVVLIPCQMKALSALIEREEELKEKIVLKLGLYCSGAHSENATLLPLKKAGVTLDGATRLFYRRGHWRGNSAVMYQDGSEKLFSYTKSICVYKNAFYFSKDRCMMCQDQYAFAADISFGDIWIKEMQDNPIKHTSCIIRNQRALELYQLAVSEGAIIDSAITAEDVVRSQKRALTFKFNCAQAKVDEYAKEGKSISLDTSDVCKWNHKLAYKLAIRNKTFSEKHFDKLEKKSMKTQYYYMCFIRFLLSF